MKKILIIFTLLVLLIALTPLIGNKVITENINNNIVVLKSYGVDVTTHKEKHNYLKSKKEYEFVVQDGEKFALYLNQLNHTDRYTAEVLEGARFGVDVAYSNFPLADKISLNLYLLSLSENTMQTLQKFDPKFYDYMQTLLQKRALLIHQNYSIANNSFDGYLKDINETYNFTNSASLALHIDNITYEGQGFLQQLQSIDILAKTFLFHYVDGGVEYKLKLEELLATTSVESQAVYTNSIKLHNFEYTLTNTQQDKIAVIANGVDLNLSSTIEQEKATLHSQLALETLILESNTTYIKANEFKHDLLLSGIDKESYEKLLTIVSPRKVQNPLHLYNVLEKSLLEIFSKGSKLELKEFSLSSISTKKSKIIKGFKIQANVLVNEDERMAQSIFWLSRYLLGNVTVDASFVFGKDFFYIINKVYPLSIFLIPYAQEEKDKVVFNVRYKDQELFVNAKKLY